MNKSNLHIISFSYQPQKSPHLCRYSPLDNVQDAWICLNVKILGGFLALGCQSMGPLIFEAKFQKWLRFIQEVSSNIRVSPPVFSPVCFFPII